MLQLVGAVKGRSHQRSLTPSTDPKRRMGGRADRTKAERWRATFFSPPDPQGILAGFQHQCNKSRVVEARTVTQKWTPGGWIRNPKKSSSDVNEMRTDAGLRHTCTIKTERGSERDQSSQCPLWSGVPVLFLTSTKPSLLGSNQSVTIRQAGGTKWCVCLWETDRQTGKRASVLAWNAWTRL